MFNTLLINELGTSSCNEMDATEYPNPIWCLLWLWGQGIHFRNAKPFPAQVTQRHFGSNHWLASQSFDSTKGYPGEGPRCDVRIVILNSNTGKSALRFIKEHGAEVDVFMIEESRFVAGAQEGGEGAVGGCEGERTKLGWWSVGCR